MKYYFFVFFVLFNIYFANVSVATSNREDVNQDGRIDSLDAMLILKHSLRLSMRDSEWNGAANTGDVDCNGKVDSVDAMLVLRKILGLNLDVTMWCANNSSEKTIIGKRNVKKTPLSKGTIFASPNGRGNTCLKSSPCSIRTAFSKLKPGDVLFLRGGEYNITSDLKPPISGTELNPIIIESYPGENAVLVGNYANAQDVNNNPNGRTNGIKIDKYINFIKIRNLEVKNMGFSGIVIKGSNNVIEGCLVHDNILAGIVVYGGQWHENKPDYHIPYLYGNNNVIVDNVVRQNSDVGLSSNGGNADGISLSSGQENVIIHNTVYSNSDDGIDTWRTNDSFVAFNKVYDNGKGNGDGNGIKAGGNLSNTATNGLRAVVYNNITFNNKRRGIDYNSGKYDVFKYNTSYNNHSVGVHASSNTVVEFNIASNNGSQNSSLGTNNSWNIQRNIPFKSTDPNSSDFLKPLSGSRFENMGAYKNTSTHKNKIFFIGDSTVHNNLSHEMGYGTRLGNYMINPDNLINMARVGVSSKSFKVDNPSTIRDWPGLLKKVADSDLSDGAYLFIQFGDNDENSNNNALYTRPGRNGEFYNNLKQFVSKARELRMTPVLITPVERLYKNRHTFITSQGDYVKTVKELAKDEGVLLLDLNQKSFEEFNKYPSSNAVYKNFGYDDHINFDREGADKVASWLVDLICQSSDENLCNQFRKK